MGQGSSLDNETQPRQETKRVCGEIQLSNVQKAAIKCFHGTTDGKRITDDDLKPIECIKAFSYFNFQVRSSVMRKGTAKALHHFLSIESLYGLKTIEIHWTQAGILMAEWTDLGESSSQFKEQKVVYSHKETLDSDRIFELIRDASINKNYNLEEYNCNVWTNQFLSYLGIDLELTDQREGWGIIS